jgi:hypothetical protein
VGDEKMKAHEVIAKWQNWDLLDNTEGGLRRALKDELLKYLIALPPVLEEKVEGFFSDP